MNSPLSTWLRVREPADTAARSDSLAGRIAETLETGEVVHVLDLATGTGSNLRYLAPRLPGRQRWLMVDRDATLLGLIPALMSSWGAAHCHQVGGTCGNEFVIESDKLQCHVATRSLDLNVLDELDIFAGRQLVTASALLDLVSETWLEGLAARSREVGAAVLFALTYNGWSSCSPEEPEDEMIRRLLNRHQKTDKGLGGSAAGPDAAGCAARCLTDVGYRVWTEPSDWKLGASERELQRELVYGWARAATELVPDETARIAQWRARRIAHIDAGRSQIVVGHFDVAAII